jgi:hypothetical protein
MRKHTENLPETEQISVSSKDKSRKLYHKPRLEELGDLRTLTLGGSVVSPGDSVGGSTLFDWF